MTLLVHTIDPRTGEAGTLSVESENALDGEREARARGLWVDCIERVGVPNAGVAPRASHGGGGGFVKAVAVVVLAIVSVLAAVIAALMKPKRKGR